jgi:hypothetical protein
VATPSAVIRTHPVPAIFTNRREMARVSSRRMAEPQRSSVRVELLGWTATAVFVFFSYALRRFLDRRPLW